MCRAEVRRVSGLRPHSAFGTRIFLLGVVPKRRQPRRSRPLVVRLDQASTLAVSRDTSVLAENNAQMAAASARVFGEIPGYPVGSTFVDRVDLARSGCIHPE